MLILKLSQNDPLDSSSQLKHPEDDMVQTLHLHIFTIFHLNTLTRESWIGQGSVGVGLVKVEAVEVQSQEADIRLTLTHIDVARRGRGLGPVGQVLAVGLPTARNKVATHSKSTCTRPSCSASLKISDQLLSSPRVLW